jgi:hypothetical protein
MIGASKGVNTIMARSESYRQQADIHSFDSPSFVLASAILDWHKLTIDILHVITSATFWICHFTSPVVSGFSDVYKKSCFKSWIMFFSESTLTIMFFTLNTDDLSLPEETRWMVTYMRVNVKCKLDAKLTISPPPPNTTSVSAESVGLFSFKKKMLHLAYWLVFVQTST